jgi:hypothetical protein
MAISVKNIHAKYNTKVGRTRQSMYVQSNIEGLSRIIVAVEKPVSITYLTLCMRVPTCGCPGQWACECACVQIVLLIQHATRVRHIKSIFDPPPPARQTFSKLSHKRHDFRKNVIGYKMSVFIFSITFI